MNVYVESNFLLELMLEQAEAEACERLIGLAELGTIRLVAPLLALVEPQWTLNHRSSERRDVHRVLQQTHAQLRRNTSLGAESERLNADFDALLTLLEHQQDRLSRRTRQRLLKHARVLPADAATLNSAEQVAMTYDLEYFDAIMLASVLEDLPSRTGEQSCLLNSNGKDFATVSIRQELSRLNCKFFASFQRGYEYVLTTAS